MTHREILKKILVEKKIGIQDFAVSLGYGKNNYTNTLGKDNYSAKTIQRISEVLGIESSVFLAYQDGINNVMNNGVMESVTLYNDRRLEEMKVSYEKQLVDKDKIIALLERRILELEKN